MTKSMILDLKQFDSDQTKFKDQWRRIQLFLKSNRVIATDNKITAILAQLRGSVLGIYAQKKINQIEEKNKVQDQNNFVIEKIYSGLHDKVQSIGHKTETDDIYIYAIFLLKKNIRSNIIKTILGYLPIVTPETFKKWKVAIISVRQEQEPLVVEKKHLQTLKRQLQHKQEV